MHPRYLRVLSLVLVGGAISAFSALPSLAEVTLKAQSTLPTNHEISQSFIKFFVDKVNKKGKGIVKVEYVGGPEVTPPRKALGGLTRGIIDILHSPASFYAGTVPEAYAFLATNLTIDELRKNGSIEALDKIWNKKANAHILGWGQSQTQYNI